MSKPITADTIISLNYYEVFGLPSSREEVEKPSAVDLSVLQKTYRRLSLRFHPDKDSSEAARAAFAYLQQARDTLAEESKRQQYNREVLFPQSSATAAQLERQKEAEREADWAESILLQKEKFHSARQREREAQSQQEEASRRQVEQELTAALHTPFRLLERELLMDWNIDGELLEMKFSEVERLLSHLQGSGEDSRCVVFYPQKQTRSPSMERDSASSKRTHL